MKFYKAILAVPLFIGALTGCTDKWNDHYSVSQLGSGSLWQNICDDPTLSNFKQVLEATNYDAALSGSQVFTVFAPNNSALTDDMRDYYIRLYKEEKAEGVKDKNCITIKEFIQNHISLYNYSVSSVMPDTTIRMMNGKNVSFTRDTFAGHEYLTSNQPTNNGIVFTLNAIADFQPNVYEQMLKADDIDSVAGYIKYFNIEKLNSASSVPGEIIDGKTHYLDSVTYIENKLLEEREFLNALMLSEDSTYWTAVPDNSVWDELVNEYSNYYVYDEKVGERDSFQYHFPRMAVLRGTSFSKTNNRQIFTAGSASAGDSLMSTNAVSYERRKYEYGSSDLKYYQYNDPFGANGVLSPSVNTPYDCSNGRLYVANKWNFPKRSTFLKDIIMEGESSQTLDSLNVKSSTNKSGDTGYGKFVQVPTDNPFYGKVSGNAYYEIAPSGASNFSKALFDVRGVLSGVPYDVYVVLAPAMAGDTLATFEQRLPITFRCALQCHAQDGTAYYVNLKDGRLQYPVLDKNGNPTTNYTQAAVYGANRTNDPEKVDSILLGTVTFPTCSYETSEPQVKLLFQSYVGSSAFGKTANRTLRLDCIVFKPHDE
ncbi:MAG: fasciclin domain-containing protein [Bacteroidaceae bacterium]|nr:fasciclin domain-containing protein [Bacteroidaceae bacterium]